MLQFSYNNNKKGVFEMNNLQEFISQVKSLKEILQNFHYIYTATNLRENDIDLLKQADCAIQSNTPTDIISAFEKGFSRDDLYFLTNEKSVDEIHSVFGKCRYVISNFEQLEKVNAVSKQLNKKGFLESVAIEFSLDNSCNFCKETLLKLSAELKNADAIAVRGVFFVSNAKTSTEYSNYMKTAYETVKEIASVLPCKITFLNFGSCIDSLTSASINKSQVDLQFIQNANLVSYLNTTSFYSRFLIS